MISLVLYMVSLVLKNSDGDDGKGGPQGNYILVDKHQ